MTEKHVKRFKYRYHNDGIYFLFYLKKTFFDYHLPPSPPPLGHTYASDYREFLSNVDMSKLSRIEERERERDRQLTKGVEK